MTREALIRILGAPVGDQTWQQGKLPVSMGGLGLRAAENHGPAAHAASVLSAQLRVQDLVGGRYAADEDEEGAGGVLSPQLLAALSEAQGEREQVQEADLVGNSALTISFDDISLCNYRIIFKISLNYRYR